MKGSPHPMDLFSCTNTKGTVYGFLSVTWGLLSDADIESEKYRYLGVLRFTLAGIQRILSLRHYNGALYYIPLDTSTCCETGIEQDLNPTTVREKSPRSPSRDLELNTKEEGYGPKCFLPPLHEECGEEWKVIDEEFILVGLQSLSHLGSGMHSAPGVHIDDGFLDIQYVKRGTTKKTMLTLLDAFETGKHLEFDDVTRLKAKAFRLVPGKDRTGHIVIDGEEIEYETIQGEVLPSLANVVMLKKI